MRSLSPLFATTVALLLWLMLTGMFATWLWAIRQVRLGNPLLPSPTPRAVPWGLGSILLVVLTWLLVNLGVQQLYLAMTGGYRIAIAQAAAKVDPSRSDPLSYTELMVLVTVANAILILVLPLILRVNARARLADLGIERGALLQPCIQGAKAFFLIGPIVYALNALTVLLWTSLFGPNRHHPLEKMVRGEFSTGVADLAILSAVILAPAAEELIFRGIIQGWLQGVVRRSKPEHTPLLEWETTPDASDSPWVEYSPVLPINAAGEWTGTTESCSPAATSDPIAPKPRPISRLPGPVRELLRRSSGSQWLPIVLTSALFAILHFGQWPAPLAIFFLSLGLGLVFQRTGSLVASFVMHAMFNALGTLLLFQTISLPQSAAPQATIAPVSAHDSAISKADRKGSTIRPDRILRISNSTGFSVGASQRD